MAGDIGVYKVLSRIINHDSEDKVWFILPGTGSSADRQDPGRQKYELPPEHYGQNFRPKGTLATLQIRKQ